MNRIIQTIWIDLGVKHLLVIKKHRQALRNFEKYL